MNNKELQIFFTDLQEEIKAILVSEEEGANPEQIFTELALSLLSEAGETENYRTCYDEKISKRGVEHKINGFSLYENYETLDLFITIYNGDDNIQNVTKGEVEKTTDRLVKFFRNAVYKEYVNEIEESSEVFDLAQTLANEQGVKDFLTRVNVFLITNGEVKTDSRSSDKIFGYSIFYRTIDINYLFNLSDKSRIPIQINFEELGYNVPCIANETENEDYQSWLAIIPGIALAKIYEQYGARLLEQNVRSFLQFTGKINKGIRKTILEEQHMFMAFNNGIAATAEEIQIKPLPNGHGIVISMVNDLQIVNGGQTTASIYHTWKKDKVNISKVFVPVKLTIVKNRENFSDIVGRIAEYANTQNKVSISDLSSNRENHVLLEKLSRTIWTPPQNGATHQSRWFFERSRGQFKNERLRFGITASRKTQFDKQNPRNQMFTKELIGKYLNSFEEVYYGKKLVIGPHIVVRGSQKNYAQFINYNFNKKPNNIWFEDSIAKAIIFSTAERVYGIKPNSIGDMRYITVPYSLAWLSFKLNHSIDLYKIWKNQSVSDNLKDTIFTVMVKIEAFIKETAPGSLYGEYAKKEDCWIAVKNNDFKIDLTTVSDDLQSSAAADKRKSLSEEEVNNEELKASIERISSIPEKMWFTIEQWGVKENKLSMYQCNTANTIAKRIRNNRQLSIIELENANKILDIAIKEAPELFYDIDQIEEIHNNEKAVSEEVTLELVKEMVSWDRRNKVLQDYQFILLNDLAEGRKVLTETTCKYVSINLAKLQKRGFSVPKELRTK